MAVVKSPLLSLDASGSVARAIVFSKWKGRNYVRKHSIPANPRSALQVAMRAVLTFVSQYWATLSANQQALWAVEGAKTSVSGLDANIGVAGKAARKNNGWLAYPGATSAGAAGPPTGFSVAAATRSLLLTWTNGTAQAPDYGTEIHRGTATISANSIANLVAIVPSTVEEWTDADVVVGTEYFYQIRHRQADGTASAAAAEDSGTPTA